VLEVHEFEYVAAEGDLALLRLAGMWRGAAPDGDCVLVVDDEHRFDPLPQAAAGSSWRAAYSVPLDVVESGDGFVLATPGGEWVDLPQPIEHGTAAQVIAGLRERLDELEALVDRLRTRIDAGDDRLAEIERRAETLRSAIRAQDGAAA
jgi:hypothetical protein